MRRSKRIRDGHTIHPGETRHKQTDYEKQLLRNSGKKWVLGWSRDNRSFLIVNKTTLHATGLAMVLRSEPAVPLVQVTEGSMQHVMRTRDRLERMAGVQTEDVKRRADYFDTEEV